MYIWVWDGGDLVAVGTVTCIVAQGLQCPAFPLQNMSDTAWLQPASSCIFETNWLTPQAGTHLVQTRVPCSKASGQKGKLAVAASAAGAAAAAAQAAADLLIQTPKKRQRPPSVASTQKTSKAESSETSATGKAKHIVEECSMEEEHIAKENIAGTQKVSNQMSTPTRTTRAYAARGSQGTFAGRRPPKNPILLGHFLKDKAAYLASVDQKKEVKEKAKKTPRKRRATPRQEEYRAWMRTFARSHSASSRVQFKEAAAAWMVEKARREEYKTSLF